MKNINKIRERSLAQILMDDDLITPEQLHSVLDEQSVTEELMIDLVLANDYVTEWDLAKVLVKNYQIPFLYAGDYQINKDVKEILPSDFLHNNKIFPLDLFGKTLVMVTSGNIDEEIVEEIEKVTHKEVSLYITTHSTLMKILKENFPQDVVASEVSNRMDQLFGTS